MFARHKTELLCICSYSLYIFILAVTSKWILLHALISLCVNLLWHKLYTCVQKRCTSTHIQQSQDHTEVTASWNIPIHTHRRNSLSQYPPMAFQARGIKRVRVFSWGMEVPQAAKILPLPQPTAIPTLRPEPVPPTEFCPPKFQKFHLIFLSILITF